MSHFLFCELENPIVRSGGLLHGVVSVVSLPATAFSQPPPAGRPLDLLSFFIPANFVPLVTTVPSSPGLAREKANNNVKVARSLKLVITGVERAGWTELIAKDLTGDEDFRGDRKIFEHTLTLWSARSPSRQLGGGGAGAAGGEADNGDFVLENILSPGSHSFGFSVKLPDGIPGSFEMQALKKSSDIAWTLPNKFGAPISVDPASRVEFSAVAYIELKDATETGEYVKLTSTPRIFRVLENVRQEVVEKGPVTESASKTFLFGGKHPLHLKVFLPRTAWFSNEAIPLVAEIRNLSAKKVDSLSMSLKQITTVKGTAKARPGSPAKTHELEEVVFHHKVPNTSVDAHDSRNFDLIFQFPDTFRSSTISLAEFIKVRFELKVEVCVTQAFNLDVVFPLHVLSRLDKDTHLTGCVLPEPVAAPAPLPALPSKPRPTVVPAVLGSATTTVITEDGGTPSPKSAVFSSDSSASLNSPTRRLFSDITTTLSFGKKIQTSASLSAIPTPVQQQQQEPIEKRPSMVLADDVVVAGIDSQFDESRDSLSGPGTAAATIPNLQSETSEFVGPQSTSAGPEGGYETIDI